MVHRGVSGLAVVAAAMAGPWFWVDRTCRAAEDVVPSQAGPVLRFLAADTVVGATAPRGWTHLVLKSVPRIETGDLDTLPTIASRTATLFRTVIVADVRRPRDGSGPFRLERIGLGLCVPYDGTDMVVTTSDDTPAHAALGLVEGQVLSRAEAELKKGRLLASTPTFALYGGPCTLRTRTGHVEVWLLYGLLLEPKTGALTTVVWAVPSDPKSPLAPATLVRLAPGLIYTCGLDVAAQRFLGTVPMSWSFAIRALPPGTVVVIPRAQREPFLHARTLGAGTSDFERAIRGLLASGPRATTSASNAASAVRP